MVLKWATKYMSRTTRFQIFVVLRLPTFGLNFATLRSTLGTSYSVRVRQEKSQTEFLTCYWPACYTHTANESDKGRNFCLSAPTPTLCSSTPPLHQGYTEYYLDGIPCIVLFITREE